MTSVDNSSEPDLPVSKNTSMSDVAIKEVLLLLFDDVCSLQEHSVLGSLMLGLANQMASGLVSVSQSM